MKVKYLEVDHDVKLGWSVKASFMLGGGYIRSYCVRRVFSKLY